MATPGFGEFGKGDLAPITISDREMVFGWAQMVYIFTCRKA
jgi:hypothetical protein